jgi:DNA mismatch repair ATPase MutL
MQRAVDGMKSASERLTDGKDAGLGTQRIQEDVVKTLDRLLQEAQRRQSKSSSSQSSSKRSSKEDPSEKNGQQQKQRQQQQRQRQSASQSAASGDQDSAEGTRDDAVAEMQELTESRIEWGRLPERVRELVLQGRRDRVSTIYERLTREYYKRLAEEASR